MAHFLQGVLIAALSCVAKVALQPITERYRAPCRELQRLHVLQNMTSTISSAVIRPYHYVTQLSSAALQLCNVCGL